MASILLRAADRMAIPPRRDLRPLLLLFSLITMVMLSMPLAAAPPDLPVISIGLDDYGNVPVGRLIRAQADVAQVYCDVGVEIAWRETRHLSTDTPPARTRFTPSRPGLTIIILSPDMVTRMAPPSAALGTAPGSLDGPGHIAYVFYSRNETDRYRYQECRHRLPAHAPVPPARICEVGHVELGLNACGGGAFPPETRSRPETVDSARSSASARG